MHLPLPSSLFPPTHVCALHDIARYKPTRFATANYQPPTTSTHVSHQPPTAAQPPTTYCQPLTGSQHNQHPATTSSQSPTTSHRPPATGSQHKQQPPAGVNHKLPNPPDTYPSRKSPLRYLQVPIPPKYVFPNTHQVPSRYLSLPNTSSQPPIPPPSVLPTTCPSPKGPPDHQAAYPSPEEDYPSPEEDACSEIRPSPCRCTHLPDNGQGGLAHFPGSRPSAPHI